MEGRREGRRKRKERNKVRGGDACDALVKRSRLAHLKLEGCGEEAGAGFSEDVGACCVCG